MAHKFSPITFIFHNYLSLAEGISVAPNAFSAFIGQFFISHVLRRFVLKFQFFYGELFIADSRTTGLNTKLNPAL
jgi:hypothetical protein